MSSAMGNLQSIIRILEKWGSLLYVMVEGIFNPYLQNIIFLRHIIHTHEI